MGGRGARLGISVAGHKYGSEYHSVLERGKIKFVKSNSGSASAPMETMSKGRVYVTVNKQDNIKAISFYLIEKTRDGDKLMFLVFPIWSMVRRYYLMFIKDICIMKMGIEI